MRPFQFSLNSPTYFIADIGANHDGSLDRALKLIDLAAEAGADSIKFQHFRAPHIVSKMGFAGLKIGHQAKWATDVYTAYEKASLDWSWTPELKATCDAEGVQFMSTPYDLEAVDHLEPFVNAYKIGSGDITYLALIEKAHKTGKPVIISTGASNSTEVARAAKFATCILQCNSNYTGKYSNMLHVNLRVIPALQEAFPGLIIGLSDHNVLVEPVMGAVALGAKIIEKHFTDDPQREGPDHAFSLDPEEWQDMVERTRNLEACLGTAEKKLEDNERETVIVQRRALRAAKDLAAGRILRESDIVPLRPAPEGSLPPYKIGDLVGKKLQVDVWEGDCFYAESVL